MWPAGTSCATAALSIPAPARARTWSAHSGRRTKMTMKAPYPGTCREKLPSAQDWDSPGGVSWRFKVPDGKTVSFQDLCFGEQKFAAGKDFADFLVWRRDDVPAYQLAVVVYDHAMQISQVVRGADLLKSTARQLLLFDALGHVAPQYFHFP